MNNSKRKTKLTELQKAFVVQRLACFDTPTEIAAVVKDEFGIEITPQAVQSYDPTKHAGRHLSTDWRRLFENTRKSFLDDLEAHVPEANRAVRIRHLAHAVRAFKSRDNYRGMADMLERIAKEMGNVHSNRREISGRDGKPIEYAEMSDEQLNARLSHLLRLAGFVVDDEGLADVGDGDSQCVH